MRLNFTSFREMRIVDSHRGGEETEAGRGEGKVSRRAGFWRPRQGPWSLHLTAHPGAGSWDFLQAVCSGHSNWGWGGPCT